jgi:cytochrome c553
MKRILFWSLVAPPLLRRLVPAWLLEPPLLVAARHPWLALAAAAGGMAILGTLFAASGVMPLKASAGHWPITERLLQFGKRRSVSTHALAVSAPPLDDRSLVLRGAGHYDLGCRPCHGTPRGGRPQVALAMLPPPPELPSRVPTWSSAELFYIVKHGLKFTGMPAWPSQQRDDEVWAMVAFLLELPALEDEQYLTLARGEKPTTLALDPSAEPAPDIVAESCSRCHGVDGNGRGAGAFPRLAGQSQEYLSRAMRAYADGRRHSGIMASVVSGLTPDVMDGAVRFYASRPAGAAVGLLPSHDNANVARGRQIATSGVPTRDIPACVECHGPSTTPKDAAYPRLAGQYATYLELQLTLIKDRRRGGSEYVHLMHSFIDRLTPADMRDVSAFYASTSPAASGL